MVGIAAPAPEQRQSEAVERLLKSAAKVSAAIEVRDGQFVLNAPWSPHLGMGIALGSIVLDLNELRSALAAVEGER